MVKAQIPRQLTDPLFVLSLVPDEPQCSAEPPARSATLGTSTADPGTANTNGCPGWLSQSPGNIVVTYVE